MVTKKVDKEFEAWARRWKLDTKERKILLSHERGEWKPLPSREFEEMKKRLQAAVRHTRELRKKSESISLRLPKEDLAAIRAKAADEGLPYQTLIGSLVHKYAHGKKIA